VGGVLTEDDPVELLEGWIVPKMPHNLPHDGTIELADGALRPLLPSGWRLRIQSSITLADSEPEPDLVLARGDARTYVARHPGPADIGLLTEVADSSLARDRGDKARIYARAGITVYWIINLVDRQVEVYTDPTGPDPNPHYRRHQVYDITQPVPVIIAGQQVGQVAVRDLLP
jgi:Uma2 family endonuclease